MGTNSTCQNIKDDMERAIQTFVFLDLETTGLYNEPRILELALAAISRQAILDANIETSNGIVIHYGDDKIFKGKPKSPPLPRVLHKLVQLYYPRRIIPLGTEQITGLSNEIICDLPPFSECSATVILNFLNSLPPPICLVAHNGLGYDYPILKAELEHIKKFEGFQNFFCIDSLPCFKHLDQEDLSDSSEQDSSEDPQPLSQSPPLTGLPIPKFETPVKKIGIADTPERLIKKRRTEELETPVKNGETKRRNPARKAKRQLHFGSTQRVSYRQLDVFQRLFSESYNAHSAEADALALMKICIQYHKHFVRWADNNTCKFSGVKPRWTRIRKQPHNSTT